MSLKDRLGNTKQIAKIQQEEKEPAYYSTSEISEGVNSLGEIDTLFADDEINSIFVMGAKNIYIERKGKKSKISLAYRDNTRLENIIRKNAKSHGIEIDETHPHFEFNYAQGINISATLPPLSNVASMIIKCYKDKFANLKTLVENQVISKEIAIFLEALASLKLNIAIVGDINTIKTTILNAIINKVTQNNTCVIFDYSSELNITSGNAITYNFNNYSNKSLINYALSTNPDKVFLNNCNNLEAFEQYMENRCGSLCFTYCSNKLSEAIKAPVFKNVDVVIYVDRIEHRRFVSSISTLENGEAKEIFYINDFFEHSSTGVTPDFYTEIEQNAIPLSTAIFEKEYKHTYYKTISNEALSSALKKNLNVEILKKFKKDLDINEASKENADYNPEEENINDNIEQENQEANYQGENSETDYHQENNEIGQQQENNEQNL
jgi:type IV secretory pathway ATPase VirB11/archaellum biosynthesis ATPase